MTNPTSQITTHIIARTRRVEPKPPPEIFATNSQSIISVLFLFLPEQRRGMLYDFITETAVGKIT